MSAKLITVFGATGAQGGGVVRALLASEGFKVRAVTRDTESEKAKALAAQGVEVVAADMSDADAVRRAVDGAYGVFLVTQFWEKFSPELEVAQGKIAADACKAAGVEHLVFSGLEDVRKVNHELSPPLKELGNGFVVPHFDGKGEIMQYIRDQGLNATFVLVSFYFENFLGFFPPRKGDDGSYAVTVPMADKPMGGVSVGDVGAAVATILQQGGEHFGKQYGLAGELSPVDAYAKDLSEALGVTVHYSAVPVDVFASFGFPGAADLANMFGFYQNLGHCVRSVEDTRRLNPAAKSFKEWLADPANVAALRKTIGIDA